jgi:hypothetical protein
MGVLLLWLGHHVIVRLHLSLIITQFVSQAVLLLLHKQRAPEKHARARGWGKEGGAEGSGGGQAGWVGADGAMINISQVTSLVGLNLTVCSQKVNTVRGGYSPRVAAAWRATHGLHPT